MLQTATVSAGEASKFQLGHIESRDEFRPIARELYPTKIIPVLTNFFPEFSFNV